MRTQTQTHADTHADACGHHTQTHADADANASDADTDACEHTRKRMQTQTQTHANTHANACEHTRKRMRTHTQTHADAGYRRSTRSRCGCSRHGQPVACGAMPMYDYRCERCGTQFEVRRSFSEEALTVCPSIDGPEDCQSPGEGPVKRVFTGVGIAFKGSGFYKNDYGANARSRKAGRDESQSGKSSSGDKPSKGSQTTDSKSSSATGSSRSTKDKAKTGTKDKAKAGTSSSRE